MPFAPYRYYTDPDPVARRRRAITLALIVAAHIGIVLLLLRHVIEMPVKQDKPMPVTFTLADQPAAKKEAAKSKTPDKGAAPKKPQPQVTPPAAVTPPTEKEPPPLPFITMSRADMDSADLDKLPKRSADAGGGPDGSGAGKDSKSAYGPGEGPGGEQLYNPEWYRRPTDAELATYMPQSAPPDGWGMVACRTIEDYHVDNCRQLGESPLGSGYARAVRLAAWQFRVRPPRVGGRPLVGAWVRIRIDYTHGVIRQ